MHSQATTPCMEASMGFQGEGGKDMQRENKNYGLVGDFWLTSHREKDYHEETLRKPPRPGIQSFCDGGNHCGDLGDRRLVFGKGTRLAVTPSKCPWPSLSAIASTLKWFFSEPMNALFPKKSLVGAEKLVLGRKMNRLLWHNSKANQTIRGKPHTSPRPQPLQLALPSSLPWSQELKTLEQRNWNSLVWGAQESFSEIQEPLLNILWVSV